MSDTAEIACKCGSSNLATSQHCWACGEDVVPTSRCVAPPEIRSTDWMDALEASVASAISHWREFGPEHGFEECVDRLEVRLKAYRWQKESASIEKAHASQEAGRQ